MGFSLKLDYQRLPSGLIEALQAEREASSNDTKGIIRPRIKRLTGYDEALQLFLPMRTIESGTTVGYGVENIEDEDLVDVWLAPLGTLSLGRRLRLSISSSQYPTLIDQHCIR